MAQHVKGRAIIAVCDLSKYPEMGRWEKVTLSGTLILYRDGREVARTTPDFTNPVFVQEMQAIGVLFGG